MLLRVWRVVYGGFLKMPWVLLTAYTTLLLAVIVEAMSLPPIYWNSSNPMFKTSNNDHIIEVRLNDEIDFVCPHSRSGTDSSNDEFYIIWQVSKQEYDDCNIYPEKNPLLIVNCSAPRGRAPKRFTILFERYSPLPFLPEFKAGGIYYYITTSTGKEDGLLNQHQGACLYKNMKLTLKVCCETTTTSTTTPPHTTSNVLYTASSNDTKGVSDGPGPGPPSSKNDSLSPNYNESESVSHSEPAKSTSTSSTTTTTTTTTPVPRTTRWRWRETTPRNKYEKDPDRDRDRNEVYQPKKSGLINSANLPRLSVSLCLLLLLTHYIR